jgi:integrase
VYLGAYNSPESKQEYERILAQLRASTAGVAAVPSRAAADLTVNELLVTYLRHADGYYIHPDGTPTGEARNMRDAIRPVTRLYGRTLAVEFGPLALKTVMQAMVDAGLARSQINARVKRVRRVFKWAASEELIPHATYQALTTVTGLRIGRSAAHESEPIRPVEDWVVEATMPFLNRHLRAMVQLQRLTGMRPGEVVRMTWGEIDRTGSVWVYRPKTHKTQYRGRVRSIFLGQRAQAILDGFVNSDPTAFLFSPAQAREERFAVMRESRKTRVPPSQVSRRRKAPRKLPGARYSTGSYGKAISGAVKTANVSRGKSDLPLIPHWHPNQLRHTHATEVRKRYGLEAAGASLGHAKMSVTEVYAERDETIAARVASEVG